MNALAEEHSVHAFLAKHRVSIYCTLAVLFAGCCAISATGLSYFDQYNQRCLQALNEIHEGMPRTDARRIMSAFGSHTTTARTHLGEFPGADEFDQYSTDLLVGRYLTVIVIGYQNGVVAMKGGYNADRVLRAEELRLPVSAAVFSFKTWQIFFFALFDIVALYPALVAASALLITLFSPLRTDSTAWFAVIAALVGAGLSFLLGSAGSPAAWLIGKTIVSFLAS